MGTGIAELGNPDVARFHQLLQSGGEEVALLWIPNVGAPPWQKSSIPCATPAPACWPSSSASATPRGAGRGRGPLPGHRLCLRLENAGDRHGRVQSMSRGLEVRSGVGEKRPHACAMPDK